MALECIGWAIDKQHTARSEGLRMYLSLVLAFISS